MWLLGLTFRHSCTPRAPCSLHPAAMPVAWGKILLTLDLQGLSGGQGHCVCCRRRCPARSGCSGSLHLMNMHETSCRDELTCLWPPAGKQLGRDSDLAPANASPPALQLYLGFPKMVGNCKTNENNPKAISPPNFSGIFTPLNISDNSVSKTR